MWIIAKKTKSKLKNMKKTLTMLSFAATLGIISCNTGSTSTTGTEGCDSTCVSVDSVKATVDSTKADTTAKTVKAADTTHKK